MEICLLNMEKSPRKIKKYVVNEFIGHNLWFTTLARCILRNRHRMTYAKAYYFI